VEAGGSATTNSSAVLRSVRVDGILAAIVDVSGLEVSGDGRVVVTKGSLQDVYPGTRSTWVLGDRQPTLSDLHAQISGPAGAGIAGGHDLLTVVGTITIAGDLELSVTMSELGCPWAIVSC
jgi:hypothetical protein